MCRTRCVLALIALYVGVVQSWVSGFPILTDLNETGAVQVLHFAVTKGEILEFYTDGIITEAVRFDSQNLTALIYNEVQNMILYVNKQSGNDVICGYYISATEMKCFTERSGRNIHGLAFDPVTEKLFFSDTKERSINWITLKTGSDKNVNGNLLIKMGGGVPTDLAVDSCRGYVYWINTNLALPTIERAHFDGSKRKVVITSVSIFNSHNTLEPDGLAIDQQLQRIYWMEPLSTTEYGVLYADLNGKNQTKLINLDIGRSFPQYVHSLSVSKSDLYVITRRLNFESATTVFKLEKSISDTNHQYAQYPISSDVAVGIATNYKLEDKLPEIQHCEPLTRLVRNKSDGPFCVHGIQVNGQSLCKCTPGYIGERCDVSVCNNYCIQGNCSLNNEGLPECRCNAGYSGNRCEVDTCYGYCLNNGVCSLNKEEEPFCDCVGNYAGPRCDGGSQSVSFAFTSTPTYAAERNQTLAYLLSNWRKPSAKIVIIVEDESD